MNLLPRQPHFFQLFSDEAALIARAAAELHQAVQHPQRLADTATNFAGYESECDKITGKVFDALDESFITPIDPEDILSIGHNLDDIMDGLEDIAHRLVAYQIHPIPLTVIQLCEIIETCSQKLLIAFSGLAHKKLAMKEVEDVVEWEKKADALERKAVAELFASGSDPVTIIKLREIYEFLERTVDACEHVAAKLQHVYVKTG
jgi:uncharacterized protein Yka (UPF0111/DUF47 family)